MQLLRNDNNNKNHKDEIRSNMVSTILVFAALRGGSLLLRFSNGSHPEG